MNRITPKEYRALPDDDRRRVMRSDTGHYRVDSYLAPLVYAGLGVISDLTAGAKMPDYDEDDREAEIAAYRRLDASRAGILAGLVTAAGEEIESPAAPPEEKTKDPAAKALAKAQAKMLSAQAVYYAARDTITLADKKIDWPDQHKGLKTWAGQATLKKRLGNLLGACRQWDQSCDLLDYEIGMIGVSGVMPGDHGVNSRDMGFSPNGVSIIQHPWREIALLLGAQYAPILTIDGTHAARWHDQWWLWSVTLRVPPYLWAWRMDPHPRTDEDIFGNA